MSPRLAWFVSPHGFGHAARSCALIAALGERRGDLAVTLYTSVPRWFFDDSLRSSLPAPFDYRALDCDVGLVQAGPMDEDLGATADWLERLWGEADRGGIEALAAELVAAGTTAVVCDIAPLGLAVARAARLPAVLIENFTWDWIYAPLTDREPRLAPWIDRLRTLFESASLRIQTEPICRAEPKALAVGPVARAARSSPAEVRAWLGVAPGRALVLVSFGGIAADLSAALAWGERAPFDLVVPGGAEQTVRRGALHLLPHRSPIHHPDLVAAADLLIGKLGYSTVAEAVAAGTPLLYVRRPGFRESEVLERFVARELPVATFAAGELASGGLSHRITALAAVARPAPRPATGAGAAAGHLIAWLDSRSPPG